MQDFEICAYGQRCGIGKTQGISLIFNDLHHNDSLKATPVRFLLGEIFPTPRKIFCNSENFPRLREDADDNLVFNPPKFWHSTRPVAMKSADTFSWLLFLGAAAFLLLSLAVIFLFSIRRKGDGKLRERPAAPVKPTVASVTLKPKNCVLPPRRNAFSQPAASPQGASAFWVNARARKGNQS